MAYWTAIRKLIAGGLATGIIATAINDSLVSLVIFQGDSMQPTIYDSDLGLCDKLTALNEIRRGDVVVVSSPHQPRLQICKRVVALEGDEVKYQPNAEGKYGELARMKNSKFIPRGHMWLEGDNKYNSYDSRNYGPIPMGLVKSRVIGTFYPFRNATIFAREPPNKKWDDSWR